MEIKLSWLGNLGKEINKKFLIALQPDESKKTDYSCYQ